MPHARSSAISEEAPTDATLAHRRGLLDRAALRAAMAAGSCVLTPNRRLARELKRDYDDHQQGAGRLLWPAVDVLPLDAWLIRCHDEWMANPNARPPSLLSPLQQQVMWEQVIGSSASARSLRHADAIAATAGEAWDLLQRHGGFGLLERLAASEDQQAFRQWSAEFARQLRQRHALTAAQLPGALATACRDGELRLQQPLLLAGFDQLAPELRSLFDALRTAGVEVADAPLRDLADPAAPARVACADLPGQWSQVASWAAARLAANPQARIGIVLPDIGAHRAALRAALTDALAPALRILPTAEAAGPFNLSLGEPLAQAPLVATALTLLDLVVDAQPIARIGALLRSPFIASGAANEAEWAGRARLDRALRDAGRWQLSLDGLRRAANRRDEDGRPRGESAPGLAQAFDRVAARCAAAPRRQLPSAWTVLLSSVLDEAGFPGSRALDSAEFQTLQRWQELMASLGTLDALLGPIALADAVARLRRIAADTLFQPESGDAPVQVLGVLEAQQLEFDHLWVANLSDERWPPPAQPNPLLPTALQRAWQLPQSAPELSLAQARQRMDGWRLAARELVLSHAALEGDQPALPSPLVGELPATAFDRLAAAQRPLAQRVTRGGALEAVIDRQAPALDRERGAALRGGTRVFTDQSACAFRAFAVHRLHAQPLATPAPGLDPMLRGGLLHATLQAFWTGLGSQAAFRALDDRALHARVVGCAEAALDALAQTHPDLVGPRLRELERDRLQRTVHAWLDIEDTRPPFDVVTLESQGAVEIGGLRVTVRPDRVDRLEDGSLAIIDYKTGRVSSAAWLDARPDDPQLPIYATAYEQGALAGGAEPVRVLAFAQLRPGDTRAIAVAAADGLMPGARLIDDAQVTIARPGWDGLMIDWREALQALARAFIDGDAQVAPKSLAKSCQHCALPLLCRVGERASLSARLATEAADAPPAQASESGDE